ncbi:MAG: TonB-dependent receptor [Bacteroides sp.]|nr:TonB-dependent receptor [Bacteroides sp.]
MAFLKERLSLSVDFYKTTVKDMITYSPVSRITGFHTYISNDGEMENKGVDLALSGRLIDKAIKWDVGVTTSFYKNKVTKIPASYETEFNGATILTQQGSPLGLFYGYKTDGVYTTAQAAQTAGLYYMDGLNKVAYQAGDVKFINQNSDDLIDQKDRVVIGDPNPDVYGGINTALRWKRISLSALFTYSIGNDIYNYTRQQLESMSGFGNQTQAVLNRWRIEGQQTDIPRVYYGDPMGNSRFSDRWIEDGSYLKLKNLTLAYDIPVRSGVFTGFQVYGVAENLFTLTSYKGYDPEFSGTTSPLGYGIDAFMTPRSRTFYVGIKIGL